MEVDVTLWPLEFEFYIQPLLNRAAWDSYEEQCLVVTDLGLDPSQELIPPQCPIPIGWISEFTALTDDLLGDLTLPRLDHATGDAFCADWEEAAAWRADVDVAVAALPEPERWLFDALQQGKGFSYIAMKLKVPFREAIDRARSMNIRVRQKTRIGV